MSYTVGQLVHLTAAFAVSSVATDPTSLTLTIKDPDGVITTPAPTKDSVGNYHYDFSVTKAGTHWHTWRGTGACQAANQASFDVAGGHTT